MTLCTRSGSTTWAQPPGGMRSGVTKKDGPILSIGQFIRMAHFRGGARARIQRFWVLFIRAVKLFVVLNSASQGLDRGKLRQNRMV
jgi:hypothetical protein